MEDLEIGFGDRLAALLLFSAVTYKLMPTSLYLLISISFIGFLIWRQWQGEKYWRQRGISGPETSFLLGNTIELLRTGPINFDQQNFAKFGRAYGAFVFGRRFLMTMDAEMMKRVLVKDFSHFPQRWNPGQMPDDGSDEHEPNLRTHNVAMITGEDWRRVRNLITPAFTTGKLKRMLPNLQESAHRLCECIEKDFISPQKEIPLKELFSRLVLDQIGRGGFSLDLNTFEEGGGEPNLFIQNASKFFAMDSNRWIAMFPFICYSLKKWLKIDVTTNSSIRFFYNFMSDLYEQRKADPEAKEKYNDIFQLLMNVVNEGAAIENGNVLAEDADIIHREIWTAKGSAKQLSPGELFANAITIMVAGYDTTASALNFMFFLLARHPEQQERLREEICEVLGDETQISHEHLKRMHYLHAVVRETLRIYSPVSQTNRECTAGIDVEGIALQKGDIVGIPVHAIHRSELFYEEPEKFMPERWLPGANNIVSNPLAFLTFGYGPRNCIGMRVAEFQMYVTVATLLRRFRFRPGPNTPQHPVQLESMANGLVQPVKPIFVMVEHFIA